MTPTEEQEWQERLRAAVEATLAAKERKRQERAQRKAQRDWGLVQRYALKAARNRRAPTKDER